MTSLVDDTCPTSLDTADRPWDSLPTRDADLNPRRSR